MQDEVETLLAESRIERMRDIPVRVRQRPDVVVGECLLERVAELAPRPRDQDSTAASRADRIGVVVLHRDATRGSFSSGSLGSNSVVTW